MEFHFDLLASNFVIIKTLTAIIQRFLIIIINNVWKYSTIKISGHPVFTDHLEADMVWSL